MTLVYAIADGVAPIKPVVPRVENRRERSGREKPFPPLPGDESQKEESTNDGRNEPPTEEERDENSDQKIDIHVAGMILPTRQLLPPPTTSHTLH